VMLRLPVVRDVFFGGDRALGVDRFSGHGTEGPISMGWTPYYNMAAVAVDMMLRTVAGLSLTSRIAGPRVRVED
jgi:hypothetical protein